MTINWTQEDIDIMRTLWAQGKSSRDISNELPCQPTRNAVMGKLNRLGLMGLGKPTQERLDAIKKVSEILDAPFFMGDPLHKETLLTLMSDTAGRNPDSLSLASGVSKDLCQCFLNRLPKVWPISEPMPARWDNGLEGKFAFIIDMAIIQGRYEEVSQKNRPTSSSQIAA